MTDRRQACGEPLHLVLGDYGAESLRAASHSHGLPGTVLCLRDDLSHGPLADGPTRLAYMQACYPGYDHWPPEASDPLQPWSQLNAQIEQDRPASILVWAGDNASEAVLLAMACWRLLERPEPIHHLQGIGPDAHQFISEYRPAALRGLFDRRRCLSDAERSQRAADFVRLRDSPHGLRRWESCRLLDVPADYYDPLLKACCPGDWTPAARVVAAAMARCDAHNRMSDLFFSSRLQILIDSDQVAAQGPRRRLADYAVRLIERSG